MPTRSTTARTTVERMTLPNGLRVLVAPDRTSPRVGVAVIYDVGFRTEPEGLTGFAHLFEHLMFQGSANVGKSEHMQLVQGAGGQVNGNTQADMTRYFEAVPSDALELMLWCEADRMRSLALTEENLRNQIDVVKEEIKVNVLNRPYGGFPWIPLPALAFDTYPNAHNGYGDFVHLESASLEDAAHFYATYYTPLNAVLAVTGDTSTEEVFELAHRHFGDISAPKGRKVPPHGPYREPLLSKQRRKKIYDPLAPQPAFSVAFRAPDPEHDFDSYVAHVVLADLLSSGDASRLTSRLVYKDRVVTDVGCMIGTFGMDTFQMRDPILFQILAFHPGAASTDDIVRLIDDELESIAADGPRPGELARIAASTAASHWRSLDGILERSLAIAAGELIHGNPDLILQLPHILGQVDDGAVAKAAARLLAQKRAVLELEPGTDPSTAARRKAS